MKGVRIALIRLHDDPFKTGAQKDLKLVGSPQNKLKFDGINAATEVQNQSSPNG